MTSTRKNQFEELIDAMMIEEVAGLDNDLKAKLEGLPLDKKRIGILSILDKDRGLFMKIMNMVNDNHVTKSEHIKHLVGLMREYVKVGEVEKKTLGEVMTPQSLVNDMLDTLPTEVWSNPNLKWLDPCSGVGVFSAVIVERLMNGLSEIILDEEQRYRHIVEEMIYVGELQPKNMFLHLCSFDPKDEYELNVYCGSFLDEGFDEHMKDVWGIEKFDVIVMNPPYQGQSGNKGSNNTLWDKFVYKTIDILFNNGYLVAVHPSGWRNIGGQKGVGDLLKSKQITYLEIHDEKDGVKVFGANTRYDFYCLKNTINTGLTRVKDEKGEILSIDFKNSEFIPNFGYTKIAKLIAKEGEERINLIKDSTYHTHNHNKKETRIEKFETEYNKYPVIYSVNVKDEPKFRWSCFNDKGHFGVPKVIFGSGATGFLIDSKGEYGQTQFARGIIDEVENLELIKQALKSVEFKEIIKIMAMGSSEINVDIMKTFRKDFWKEFLG